MNFEVAKKNLELEKGGEKAVDKAIKRLQRITKGLKADETTVFISLRRHLKPIKYSARINFKLLGHLINARDHGFTFEESLNKTADNAREQIIKLKDRLKDFHERKRRSKIKT